jgi:anti-sigma factor RsiW
MSDAPTARTIRLYSDGELPDQQARAFEEHLRQDPRLRDRVEFERRLRQHVGEVMRADRAPVPAGLSDRIREALAAGPPTLAGPAWWRGPNRANLFAVAACLALVAGAVLFGILGPPIDTLRARSAAEAAEEAAAAVAGEHVTSSAGLTALVANARFHTADEARAGLAPLIGPDSNIFDLSDIGYEFVAGDRCDIPNCPEACHLIFRKAGGAPGIATLHVVADRGQFAVMDNRFPGPMPCRTLVVPEGPRCQKNVLVWSYGGRAYLLVVCIDDDGPAVAARMQESLVRRETAPRG